MDQDNPATVDQVAEYIGATLGVEIPSLRLRARLDHGLLPYHLAYNLLLWDMDLLGNAVGLVIDCGVDQVPASALRKCLDGLARASNLPILIYAIGSMSAERRHQLIAQSIAFAVPGKQLYLPPLGIDLRELFGHRKTQSGDSTTSTKSALSASAQASFITMMISVNFQRDWSAMELAVYTHVSVSAARMALGELVTIGAVKHLDTSSRSPRWAIGSDMRKTWGLAKSVMRSPVLRTIWVPERAVSRLNKRFAGSDALSRQTTLSPPRHAVYAFPRYEWLTIDRSEECLEPEDGLVECQLWSYSPFLDRDSDCVDSLSLALSLQNEYDDRIQVSLEEMLAAMDLYANLLPGF